MGVPHAAAKPTVRELRCWEMVIFLAAKHPLPPLSTAYETFPDEARHVAARELLGRPADCGCREKERVSMCIANPWQNLACPVKGCAPGFPEVALVVGPFLTDEVVKTIPSDQAQLKKLDVP